MIKNERVTFRSDNLNLSGTLMYPATKQSFPAILIMHGGGKSNKSIFEERQKHFAENGIVSLAFDFRGVGESDGDFSDGSLFNRLQDAQNAYRFFINLDFVDPDRIGVAGVSMGGHIAARLVGFNPEIKSLLLCAAAAYSRESEDKRLNEEFTQAIRKANSWIDSPAFSALDNYDGNVMVIYGDHDTIIPTGVQQRYSQFADQGRHIVITNANHLFERIDPSLKTDPLQEYYEVSYKFFSDTLQL